MKVKPLGSHLNHLTEQELIEGEYTVMWQIESKDICPNCGDNRIGKGSFIFDGQAFCSEDHFNEWHAAKMEKYSGT